MPSILEFSDLKCETQILGKAESTRALHLCVLKLETLQRIQIIRIPGFCFGILTTFGWWIHTRRTECQSGHHSAVLSLQASSSPVQRPGGRQTVTMIPGDGVGPELMTSVKDVFTVAGVPVDFEEMFIRWVSPKVVVQFFRQRTSLCEYESLSSSLSSWTRAPTSNLEHYQATLTLISGLVCLLLCFRWMGRKP